MRVHTSKLIFFNGHGLHSTGIFITDLKGIGQAFPEETFTVESFNLITPNIKKN